MYEENVYKNLPLCTELFQSAKHRMPLNKIFAIILCVFVHMEKQVGGCAVQWARHRHLCPFPWPLFRLHPEDTTVHIPWLDTKVRRDRAGQLESYSPSGREVEPETRSDSSGLFTRRFSAETCESDSHPHVSRVPDIARSLVESSHNSEMGIIIIL